MTFEWKSLFNTTYIFIIPFSSYLNFIPIFWNVLIWLNYDLMHIFMHNLSLYFDIYFLGPLRRYRKLNSGANTDILGKYGYLCENLFLTAHWSEFSLGQKGSRHYYLFIMSRFYEWSQFTYQYTLWLELLLQQPKWPPLYLLVWIIKNKSKIIVLSVN